MLKISYFFFLLLIVCGLTRNDAHRIRSHKTSRRHRALPADMALRFEPEPFNKRLELSSSGKIHCKVAGGSAPSVQWFLNAEEPLPEGMTSSNGTLVVTDAAKRHSGQYTCKATDGDTVITSSIKLDVVVSPKVISPSSEAVISAVEGGSVWLHCRAVGDPPPTTHWDRNRTILGAGRGDIEVEGGDNETDARVVLYRNGSLLFRSVWPTDAGRYGCTAGSSAGLHRHDLTLSVQKEGEYSESSGIANKAVLVSVGVAAAYMVLVLALMYYCRRRKRRAEKVEIEMTEGREKLVEDGEEEKKPNGVAKQNGRLLAHDKDSGPDNSESCVSRASKKSTATDQLRLPNEYITEQILLGRGEFGDVFLGKLDMNQLKRLRGKECKECADVRPVLVKALTTKDENQLVEIRRQMDMFSKVRHENLVRLLGVCNDAEPHLMVLEHTDWGELKQFLVSGRPHGAHRALLGAQLAAALAALAGRRMTHRDIAARNCMITSKLRLKLSLPAMSRGPYQAEYCKIHDQVIPLRWLPAESVVEGDYSTKSDVYMFAATVWEIYTKAELPFSKLNDNSVIERTRKGTLDWAIPEGVPDRLAELLKKCWSKSPSDRPLFDDIVQEMNSILAEETAQAKITEDHPITEDQVLTNDITDAVNEEVNES